MSRNRIPSMKGTAGVLDLNDAYRNGGNLVEDREYGRDVVTQMEMLRQRPDVLASVLRDMGVTESGDEVSEEESDGTYG